MEAKIRGLVDDAKNVLVLMADNPDADSLGSALALEHILGDMGKHVALYCGVSLPTYLHYVAGWDRVSTDLPKNFDLSIIVDVNTYALFDQLQKNNAWGTVRSKPVIVLDHHKTSQQQLDFAAAAMVSDDYSSTGELLYMLAKANEWPVSAAAAEQIMHAILGDTQGLINTLVSAQTYRVMADLTELGANRPKLEELRREFTRYPQTIYKYKAALIERTEFAADGKIAWVSIPQAEINEFSPLYNPAVLIQYDTLQVEGVELSVVCKAYDNGRITGKLRSSQRAPIADKLAEHFGGGGHAQSAGFKVEDGRSLLEIKTECIKYATELLNEVEPA